ncbi:alginate export protein [Flavobacterium cauense R2A-7]|uniref:Alginate export protein n=1 Tax=Flavobacterium cauense R2A-7 TaxID=1341154 RepID=A0A562M6B1_9FLAO|nr:alginate export family protein [Flavobacterium cauense]KGO82397.1 hypothetical protein Q762_06930 [Flavobacterium cauense R2A-7]TWI15372.1 alginate export protein [Flavobacterium cauense R2A-7]
MKKTLSILLFISLLSVKALSQTAPNFKSLRYDEDYSYLKNDSTLNWYDKMKYTPLSKEGNTFISYGGEARFQYFYTKNETWGDDPKDNDGYVMSRFLFHTDFHAGKTFRLFAQLQSSLVDGRIQPSPVEENPLDLHQAFVDVNLIASENTKFTFRIGRQELMYGSQRLVSVRENPNNRQSFDAVRALFIKENYKFETFYGHYVASKREIFDDHFNKNTKLWGTYFTFNHLPVVKNIDLYYLGLWKRKSAFNDGVGKELRHSVGVRLFSTKEDWKYDTEAVYQFGDFWAKNISAWTASVNTSYKFSGLKLKPEVGLKTELVSGDGNMSDNKLQTFNPLFPKGAYFGFAALIGPSNLIDVHPSVSLELSKKVSFDVDYDLFWRQQSKDGLYAPNVALIYSDGTTNEKHIGNQLSGTLNIKANDFLNLRGEFTWFDSGNYLKEVGSGKDVVFAGFTAQLKF